MKLERYQIDNHNESLLNSHQRKFNFLKEEWSGLDTVLNKLIEFQIAIPSWALGTGGTRVPWRHL